MKKERSTFKDLLIKVEKATKKKYEDKPAEIKTRK
jgi:hypothetical protein